MASDAGWKKKNLWYFLGAISGFMLGCAAAIAFQSRGADLRIIGAWIFISRLLADDLFPFTVLHREMRQFSLMSR